MNAKEVVLRAINNEKPPRLAAAIFSGGAWTFNNKGYTLEEILGKPELAAQLIIETNGQVRSDIVWAGSGYNNLPVRALGGKIKFRPRGTPDVVEPLLKKAADVDKINLDRLEEDEGVGSLLKTTALLDRAIGDHTLIGGSGWGPFSLAAQFYGVEKMMRGLYTDQAAVHAVLEFAAEAAFRYYVGFVKAGARILSIAEPTASGDLISRPHFEKFTLPHLIRFIGRTKEAGALNLLHICGNITNRLDLIPGCGADVLSVDYKVDLARVKETVGDRLAFAGNVNPVDVLENATPAEVAAVSRQCIEKAGRDSNFILMPGCDISTGVPMENAQAMIETGLNWEL
ncbi:MAG: Uroporphyrinogen decarboxylase [Pelotomaculum sp. PtaU1.Bin035]|nr:MAG: Uroporphyrinogen decarboxylase [Pelotomaculum sp. PtaU1.Bin035]